MPGPTPAGMASSGISGRQRADRGERRRSLRPSALAATIASDAAIDRLGKRKQDCLSRAGFAELALLKQRDRGRQREEHPGRAISYPGFVRS